jgi:pyruvate,orthophosphate dikinase
MADRLGNKGANLAEMARMGLPVPPGFILTTGACRDFFANGNRLRPEIRAAASEALDWLGSITNQRFGCIDAPLLVSVRSGAAISMPGMLDTVLNLGLNDATTEALAARTGNERFVLDSYRRLIQMYGDVVLGVDANIFDEIISDYHNHHGIIDETQIDAAGLGEIIGEYQSLIAAEIGEDYPQDVNEQFFATIEAVFSSWFSARAVSYRAINGIDNSLGTAVSVQLMVFGNHSPESCSGVAFTRDPSGGAPGLTGEYLPQAQGEDVVAGLHVPRALSEADRVRRGVREASLQSAMPVVYDELVQVGQQLEARFRDMQDMEFTVEDGRLWLLQTRSGKRTTAAAIRIALDMLDEGLITREQAIARVPMNEFDRLVRPVIDPDFTADIIAKGLPASPGTVCGAVVFAPHEAMRQAAEGLRVVLVRNETSPDDVAGINAAAGLLTRRGGMTSHAAVVARAMGRPCVVGAAALRIDAGKGQMWAGDRCIAEGEEITIDGSSGLVIAGRVPMCEPKLDAYTLRFKGLVDGRDAPAGSR